MVVWLQNPFDGLPAEGCRKQRYWLMAEAFAAAGHQVVYFTSDFSHARKARREGCCNGQDARCPGIELRFVPTPSYTRNVGLRRIWSHRAYAREWERMAVGTPQLIISSFPTISAAAAALRLGRRFGAKVVIDVQDAWPETFERLAPRVLRGLFRLALTPLRQEARRIFRAADLVTGACDQYRVLTGRTDYLRAYLGIEQTKSMIDRTGGDGSTNDYVRLVYAGNLGRTYDLQTIVRAVEQNQDFSLDVAGFGAFSTNCPRVKMHGLLAADKLQKLLACCDVGIVPMNGDSWVGLPNKVFDYSAAGLPVVASLDGELGSLLKRYRCGATYRPGDESSLAAAIRLVMTLPANGSRRMCEAEFAADRIYSDYVKNVLRIVFSP